MLKKKIIQASILSISVVLLSSGVALADTGVGKTVVLPAPDQPILAAPDQLPVGRGQEQPIENKALLQKQREIDEYVFEQHKEDIEQHGFSVTRTGQIGDYVEVGITPYSEENANYLYSLFGNDMVKVVEGQQPVLMTGIAVDSIAPAAATNSIAADKAAAAPAAVATAKAPVLAKKSSAPSIPLPLIYTIGGVIVLGGVGAYTVRKVSSNR